MTYSLVGYADGVFEINDATGMITVAAGDIADSTGGPTEADADAKYTRSDGGLLADAADEFSDITYTFQVMVSDGISANNQYITATVDGGCERAYAD